MPENKLVTISTFCAETDYPGVTKWHLRVTFAQSFDPGTVYATLNAAYSNYVASGAQVRSRPYSSRVASVSSTRSSAGSRSSFEILTGDGASSEVKIDWNMTAERRQRCCRSDGSCCRRNPAYTARRKLPHVSLGSLLSSLRLRLRGRRGSTSSRETWSLRTGQALRGRRARREHVPTEAGQRHRAARAESRSQASRLCDEALDDVLKQAGRAAVEARRS